MRKTYIVRKINLCAFVKQRFDDVEATHPCSVMQRCLASLWKKRRNEHQSSTFSEVNTLTEFL